MRCFKSLGGIAGVVAIGVAVACTESTGPAEIGTYTLHSIAGEEVPSVFLDGDFSTLRILADTLILWEDGTGRETWLYESTDKTAGSDTSYTVTDNLEYSVTNGRIEIAYECHDFAICAAPPHLAGVFTDSGLEFDLSLGRVPLVFHRIGGM